MLYAIKRYLILTASLRLLYSTMGNEERRKGSRVPAESLPPLLKEFIAYLGTSGSKKRMKAKTIDAGERGISVILPVNVFKVKDYQITLRAVDGSFSITDDIVYIKALSPETSRVSIMFSSRTDVSRYRELLNRHHHHL